MSLTLGLTGMDPATETALRAAFVDANARLGGHWALVPDAEADHVVVDMDSMYGPMSWLRLHAAGRKVIGLTSAPRTQTDYRLGRPFDTDQMVDLLVTVAQGAGTRLQPVSTTDAKAEVGTGSAAGGEVEAAAAAGTGSAGMATDDAPPVAVDEEAAAGAVEAAPAAVETDVLPVQATQQSATPVTPETPATPSTQEAPTPATTTPEPHAGTDGADPAANASDTTVETDADAATAATADAAPPAPPTERSLAAWLQPGLLRGRRRFASGRGPMLLIDADAELWHGPATLKPLAPCFEGAVDEGELEPIDADTWQREAAAAGAAQPLARLRWLGGLLAGGGALVPGVDPGGRFQLTRWPQTEREFPRHFRIATQMMKGPATVAEIAEASGMPEADVADFLNANLATGFAEPVVEAPAVAEPAKPRGGLLGRLRR